VFKGAVAQLLQSKSPAMRDALLTCARCRYDNLENKARRQVHPRGNVRLVQGRDRMPRERRRILFSGRVQGVGFRYTSASLARAFEVAGYVRNLADGRVELVAEGEPSEIDDLVAAIRSEMSAYIKEVDFEPESSGAGPLSGFSIRH
jgi:acylphosphatase